MPTDAAATAEVLNPKLELLEALQQAAAQRARQSLVAYTKHTFPVYDPAPHLLEVADGLEAVERRDIDRLIITVPVRHGKSLLGSKRFPLWFMGRNPQSEIIHASYGGQLVSDFGAEMRNLTVSPAHRDVFPRCVMSQDSKAANRWRTRQGGIYIAAGVGGGITGRGMDLGVIDDPIRGREDADSERIRDKVYEWYQNDFYSRLLPGGRIVVIGSRWHEDDLIGRLLNDSDGWHVIHQKALQDDGTALWPARYPVEALARIRRTVGDRAWNALYQGEPTQDQGTYFERESLRYEEPPPASEMSIYGASDYATTDGAGDWTVHLVWGIDQWDRIWVLDIIREQADSARWVVTLLYLMRKWSPICWGEEKGPIAKSVGPLISKAQKELGVWVKRKGFTAATDKPSRARSIQGYISLNGGLWIPPAQDFTADLVKELMAFPYGTNDDQVDCLSIAGMMIEWVQAGQPEEPEAPKRDPMYDYSVRDKAPGSRV